MIRLCVVPSAARAWQQMCRSCQLQLPKALCSYPPVHFTSLKGCSTSDPAAVNQRFGGVFFNLSACCTQLWQTWCLTPLWMRIWGQRLLLLTFAQILLLCCWCLFSHILKATCTFVTAFQPRTCLSQSHDLKGDTTCIHTLIWMKSCGSGSFQ